MDYTKLIVKAVQDVPPSGIRKYFDILTDKTISLGVGEPDFPTPEAIRQEALERLSHGRIPYSSNSGMPELRELISKYLDARYGVHYEANGEILVTVGASQAIDLAIRALITRGDEVIIPEPTYVAYNPGVIFAGGVPVNVVTTADNKFKLTAEALKAAITPRTKALLLPFPNNPTGGIMEKEDLEAIAEVLRGTDILVLADEIYSELTYGGKQHVSICSLPDMRERTVVLNGFSKAFSMTGWRLGYAAAPQPIIAAMTKINQLTMLSAPTPAQYAGIAALRQGFETDWRDMKAMMNEYDRRRRVIIDGFNELGMTCNEPEGAFYVFPSIAVSGLSSEEFCDRLLAEQDVCMVPGTAFGPSGEGYVRCCYATDIEDIREALRRTKVFLESLKK
ncbi:MAG: aminotransferase class I/II-fold pyridoxal phosphate-dependent enzyme [Clostridia bacterium]|nr:aminotransferase class I/II-fold pyridoxal phosphate-dependent enzyme [Clostridia bacterium]MBR6109164.1 aminotransferase class I/II-fold pyridoxal phosphate-dependent enzyme [Clostridia bacterium]